MAQTRIGLGEPTDALDVPLGRELDVDASVVVVDVEHVTSPPALRGPTRKLNPDLRVSEQQERVEEVEARMSDSKKAVVLPLAHNGNGDVRGLVLDETGIRSAEFTRIEEGRPIMGEYVELKGREGSPLVDAEFHSLPGVPEVPPEERTSRGRGPARVNSRAYEAGWERIFGKKSPVGEA